MISTHFYDVPVHLGVSINIRIPPLHVFFNPVSFGDFYVGFRCGFQRDRLPPDFFFLLEFRQFRIDDVSLFSTREERLSKAPQIFLLVTTFHPLSCTKKFALVRPRDGELRSLNSPVSLSPLSGLFFYHPLGPFPLNSPLAVG